VGFGLVVVAFKGLLQAACMCRRGSLRQGFREPSFRVVNALQGVYEQIIEMVLAGAAAQRGTPLRPNATCADDFNGTGRVTHNRLCNASEQPSFETGSAVRAHDDQVGIPFLGIIDDR
jgi:hypothetical protein